MKKIVILGQLTDFIVFYVNFVGKIGQIAVDGCFLERQKPCHAVVVRLAAVVVGAYLGDERRGRLEENVRVLGRVEFGEEKVDLVFVAVRASKVRI